MTNKELRNFIGHTISFADGRRVSLLHGGNCVLQRTEQDDLYAKYSFLAGNIIEITWTSHKERYIVYKDGNKFYMIDKHGRRHNVTSIESVDVETMPALDTTGGLGDRSLSGSENRSGIPLTKAELEKLLVGHTVSLKNGHRMSLARNGDYVFSRAGRADVRATYVIPAGNILLINSSHISYERYLYYREGGSHYAIDRFGRRLDIDTILPIDQNPRSSRSALRSSWMPANRTVSYESAR